MIQSSGILNAGVDVNWVFLSPHLDDSVLSAGGLIAERVKKGDAVEIWTICAGDPPKGRLTPFARSLHKRWNTDRSAPSIRRAEDILACRKLGAFARHFTIPDCIYRKHPITGEPIIQKEGDIEQALGASQAFVVDEVTRQLKAALPTDCRVVSPLAIGSHIDHQITRKAAEKLNLPLWFLVDYPYITFDEIKLSDWIDPNWQLFEETVSRASLAAWQAAIAEYRSQISTFWADDSELKAAMEEYWKAGGGCKLWGNIHPMP